LNAGLFLVLLGTGLLIYVPSVKAPAVDGYRLVPLLHVLFGFAFILAPLVLVVVVRGRRRLAADVAGALTPTSADGPWLRYAMLAVLGARVRQPPTGKFNAGQKLNTVYWVFAWGALSATGLVLAVNFFTKAVFDAGFVERVFPLHELLAFVSVLPLAGHLYVALLNRSTRPALSGMLSGEVDAGWAKEHHSEWYADMTAPTR
jgi:formate dehydrogenase subunit gamma